MILSIFSHICSIISTRIFKLSMLGIGMFIFSTQIIAQNRAKFNSLNQANGLKSGDVMCFEQDHNGFVWIGTKYGLNVFDGSDFNVYDLDDKLPFRSDISTLKKRNGEEMWIGTLGAGLFLFRSYERSISYIPLGNSGDTTKTVNCLQDWQSDMWIGTDIGLFSFRDDKANALLNPHLQDQNITAIAEFNKGLAIATRDSGLYLLDQHSNLSYLGFINDQVNALQTTASGKLLVGTQSTGLYCVTLEDTLVRSDCLNVLFEDEPPLINIILVDSEGTVWIGTDGKGLYKLRINQDQVSEIEQYTYDPKKRNSIPSNAIFSLFEDIQGNIWIGTIWKGLSVLNHGPPNSDFYFSDLTGEEPYPVLAVYKKGGEMWIGTDGKGLNIIDEHKQSVEKVNSETDPALSGDYVQSIFRDSKGYYWIGTFSSGLNRYDREKGIVREYLNDKQDGNSISYNDIRTILEDDHTDLWIATWGGGLNQYDRDKDIFIQHQDVFREAESHLTHDITSICYTSDREGLWIGTFGNGLFLFEFESKKFRRISDPAIHQLKILTLKLDEDGILWIGTWGEGIRMYDTFSGKEQQSESLHQISTSRITSIEIDENRYVWFSSKNGIYKYSIEDSKLYKYGGFDLIINKEFHINSSFTDTDGKIYFGGIEGIIELLPLVEDQVSEVTPPVITSILLFNELIPYVRPARDRDSTSLKLTHLQNYFTFRFSTPYFPVSEVEYSYKLDNFNEDWVYIQDNQAAFPNLPPGKYAFKVRASIDKTIWSDPTELSITISQPYWKRWYAYMIYISLFILLLYLFQKYTREWEAMKSNLKMESFAREKDKELHLVKQRFLTNISHEIRTPVTLMLGATNRLLEHGQISKEHKREVEVLRGSSRHLLHLINELLDFRRLESDGIKLKVAEGDFLKFSQEIYLSFQSQANSNSIDYRMISRGDELELWYDRDQMEKVLFNLISNAFKFTPSGGTITIELDEDDQFVYLKVIDSGKGVEEEQLSEIFNRFYQSENAIGIREPGSGLGLSIARDIVKMHSGEISAENNTESGINIAIKLPKGKHHFTQDQVIDNFKSSEDMDQYLSSVKLTNISFEDSLFEDIAMLIVEDNDSLREYLQDMFSDGLKVHTASNGEEGLKLANELMPDIIISDVMMPLLDGVSMTKTLKTNINTSHIPILLLTARTNLIYKKEGFDVGADDYITKPFNEILLKTRVHNILKNRKKLREKVLNEYISKPREELNISTPDQKFIADLTSVIESNIEDQQVNAKLLTEKLGMSHSVIYKKIKSLTGLTLIEFVRDFKLSRAAVLLSKYHLNITDVCYRVGFSDRRYFSKIFKSKFGITPTEFVRKNRKS